MNTFVKYLVPAALSVVALSACQREIDNVQTVNPNIFNITVKANINELEDETGTKTYIGNDGEHDNAIIWGTDEYMMIGLSDGTNTNFGKSSDDSSDWEGDTEAKFEFSIDQPSAQDNYTIMGMYPWSAAVKESNTNPASYLVNLPAVQNATASSYDPAGYIMIAKSESVASTATEWEASFRRASALNKLTLTNVPEDVIKVVITAPVASPLAGQRSINLLTGANGDITGTNEIEINYATALTGISKVVWFTSWDASIPVGAELKIAAYSSNKVYSRELTVVNKPIAFKEGYLNTLSVNMANAEVASAGASYSWTLTSGDLGTTSSKPSSVEKGDDNNSLFEWSLTWGNDNAYMGSGDKGVQIGSGTYPCSSLVLSTDDYTEYVKCVRINFSHASSGGSSLSVKVGDISLVYGKDKKTNVSGGESAAYYLFEGTTLIKGVIELSFSNSASKAFYIKSIEINPDLRDDPELEYETDEFSVVANGTLDTPVLSYVDGFDGFEDITYSIGDGDDADVANVDPETGEVTIGSKTGAVTVTATFLGNDTYQAATASYTITVDDAYLNVSAVTPEKAECAAGSTVTFNVTSNVEWSATTTDNTIITQISPSSAAPSVNPVTVTVSFAANPGAERTATVNVEPTNQTAYASLNKGVTVTQKLYTADVIYEEYSGELTAGSYIIASGTSGLINTVSSSNRLGYTSITVQNSNQVLNPADALIWTIAKSGDYWTIYNSYSNNTDGNEAGYAAGTSAKNQGTIISTVTDYALWSVDSNSSSTTYDFVNKGRAAASSDSGNKYLRYNSGYGFACYASGTGGALTLYKLNDGKTDAEVEIGYSGTVTYAPNDATIQLSVTNPHDVSLDFDSETQTVATIDDDGVVTIKGAGKTKITATWSDKTVGETIYRGGSVEYELTIAKATPTITAFANAEASVGVGETKTPQTTTISDDLSITYTTSNANVATVNSSTGAVTGVSNGNVTISATFTGNDNYNAAESKSYTLVVGSGANDGSEAHPYTASEAAAAATNNAVNDVYVKGIISAIKTAYKDGVVSFDISDDGLTSGTQFRIYKASATSADDFKVGDAVEFVGALKLFSSTPELDGSSTSSTLTLVSQLHAPSFTPDGGSFTTASQSVSLAADNGAQIRYTTDGAIPTATTGNVYSSALSITATTTIKAIAVKDGVVTGVISKTFIKGYSVTLQYTTNSTTNMGTDTNEAANLGLNASDWSVIGVKNSASNNVGLNKAGEIRMYGAANGSGNSLTVSSLSNATINSIAISFKSGSTGAKVYVNNSEVSESNGSYPINSGSFVIKNTYSGTTQVVISSVTISYTPSNN